MKFTDETMSESDKAKVYDENYAECLEKLKVWLAALEVSGEADKPMAASYLSVMTPRTIVSEVENKTKEGIQFVEDWIELAIDSILNTPFKE